MHKKLSQLKRWLSQNGLQKEASDTLLLQDESLDDNLRVTVDKSGDNTAFNADGGRLVIMENSKWAQGAHSVIDFVVDEERRGQGIGSLLVKTVIAYYPGEHISAQVSSPISLKLFLNFGFSPPMAPNASFDEAEQIFRQDGGSLNLRLNAPGLGESIDKASERKQGLERILSKVGSTRPKRKVFPQEFRIWLSRNVYHGKIDSRANIGTRMRLSNYFFKNEDERRQDLLFERWLERKAEKYEDQTKGEIDNSATDAEPKDMSPEPFQLELF